ncbi:MAG: dihydrolipoamide acetyltransferase family protein [Bacteroidota bacterium]|nr:dihydrolipoamide acetyltransferase family protein [Bacteroidota bacterium]
MANAVIMPRQGQSVESCILTEWYKSVGDSVSRGELLFAYETDKAAFEEEAPEDGILLTRFYEEGDEVPVLLNVAVIGKEGEAIEEFRPEGGAVEAKETEPEPEYATKTEAPQAVGTSAGPPAGSLNTSISPRARKLAQEKRVVLEAVLGTGPGGRIIERDVVEAIRQGKKLTPLAQKKKEAEGLKVPCDKPDCGKYRTSDLQQPSEVETQHGSPEGTGSFSDVPLSNVRKIIAGAMYRSLQNSAQLTHHLSANVAGMLQLRRQVKVKQEGGYPYNITLNDMVCYAVIQSLQLHPGANAHFLGEGIRMFDQVNLGLAVDTDRGLMVPALLNADRYSLPELSTRLKEVADSSKKGSISPDLIVPEAATFTVSNLGNYGVEMFTPVINLPQVAILGVNTIIQRPATLADGTFGFQPFMGLSLTYDHRALDGGPATLFLAEIKKQIEQLSPDVL